jgi:hypothetical protein
MQVQSYCKMTVGRSVGPGEHDQMLSMHWILRSVSLVAHSDESGVHVLKCHRLCPSHMLVYFKIMISLNDIWVSWHRTVNALCNIRVTLWRVRVTILAMETRQCIQCVLLSYTSLSTKIISAAQQQFICYMYRALWRNHIMQTNNMHLH